ncbi:kinase-like domain-containing protein [Bisporella sp. PMI_857]|nr:kinase-like domain-containing protein [Bisporella sp. PMI_857]
MLSLFDSEEVECQSQAPGSAKYFNWSAICEEVNDETISTILEDTNVTVDADQELTQYILAHAKILFALAEKTDALDLVPMLAKLKLTDDHLPIVWDKTQHRAKSLSGAPKDDNALEWFKLSYDPKNVRAARRHKSWIERFCSFQWEFLAPVFTDSEIIYPLHDSCPLPFTYYDMEPSPGANSLLYKGEIHASHWKAIRRESGITTANNFNVPVAIKTITKQHEAVDKWVQVEVAALELVRSLHHPHLINFLTSYRQAGNHYLIFDWANGKNLSDFWETHSPKPYDLPGQVAQLSHRESIIWAIQQMTGLAAGLHKLHSEDEHGVHCRHGDLKPANILRSTTDDDSRLKSHGHLLITDMGVAKVNDKATHVGRSSGNVKATIRYQSPEFLFRVSPDAPTSRAYDIWSMGCTLLEFIIWLLYGPAQLKTFNNSFLNTTFFSGNLEEGIKLNGAVKHWVDYMQQHPLSKDATPCISEALKDILDFIKERVLIRDVRPELEEPTIPVDEPSPNEAQVPEIVVDAPQLKEAPAPNGWQDKQANFLELGESNMTVDEPFPIETQVPELMVDAPIIENAPVPKNWQDKRADSLELLKLLEKIRDREDLSYFLAEPPNGEGPLLPPPPPRKPTMARR